MRKNYFLSLLTKKNHQEATGSSEMREEEREGLNEEFKAELAAEEIEQPQGEGEPRVKLRAYKYQGVLKREFASVEEAREFAEYMSQKFTNMLFEPYDERRRGVERRTGEERRSGNDRRSGFERRIGAERRIGLERRMALAK
jgi:hypothetical protein